MRRCSFTPPLLAAALLAALTLLSTHALALDVVTREELKETALEYGRFDQQLANCHEDPPTSIKVAYLKYAKSRGASEDYLDLASKVYDQGRAEMRSRSTGFSPEECKAKLASPRSKEMLEKIEEWSKLPR